METVPACRTTKIVPTYGGNDNCANMRRDANCANMCHKANDNCANMRGDESCANMTGGENCANKWSVKIAAAFVER